MDKLVEKYFVVPSQPINMTNRMMEVDFYFKCTKCDKKLEEQKCGYQFGDIILKDKSATEKQLLEHLEQIHGIKE